MDERFAAGTLVSEDYFEMLGVPALIGRTLLPGDSRSPGKEPVVVLDYAAWRNRFASDRVAGKHPHAVITGLLLIIKLAFCHSWNRGLIPERRPFRECHWPFRSILHAGLAFFLKTMHG